MRATLEKETHDGPAPEVLLVSGRAYLEILRVAAEQKVDTIVMGVRGRGAIDRLLLGSATDRVVRAATCPVLTVRRG
jgi:nucleotide-binding universal stress UspA family protein